ncbi:MAG: sugar-binding protein [Armatimonadota bacterium]
MPFLLTAVTAIALLFSGPVMAGTDHVDVRSMVGAATVTSSESGFTAPSRAAIADLYEKSQATCARISCKWGDIEKQDPQVDNWSVLDSDPMMKFSRTKIVSIDLTCQWAEKFKHQDPNRYWTAVEKFVRELTKHCNERGIKYFHIAGRQYNRLDRTDWPVLVVEPLIHLYPVIKSVDKDNVVIGGNLYGGTDEDVQSLYRAGIKGYFDVLEIHPYTDKPGLGVDIDQIVSAHQAMKRNGDGDKQIFIGEGWGPEFVDGITNRDEELNILRTYLVNGYRRLLTSDEGYDPYWVLGALFNSMSDYQIGSSYKNRAKKVDEDGDGRVDCTLVDGYRLPADANTDRKFFNCGLCDIDGKPKGNLLDLLGVNLKIEMAGSTSGSGLALTYLPGIPYNLTVEAYNVMDEPVEAPNIALEADDPAVVIKDNGGVIPAVLNGTTRIKRDFTVTIPDELAGSRVRFTGKFSFKWKGDAYCISNRTEMVTSKLVEASVMPSSLIMPGVKQFGVAVINHSQEDIKVHVSPDLPEGVRINPAAADTKVEPMGLETVTFSTALAPGLKTGRNQAKVLMDGKPVKTFDVVVPAVAAREQIKVDGSLNEWQSAPIPFGMELESAVRFAYDDKALYIAVETKDPVHRQPYSGLEVWRGDSVRVAIDPLMDGALTQSGGYRDDDHEFVFATDGTHSTASRLFGKPGTSGASVICYISNDKKAVYEIAIPWSEVAPFVSNGEKMFAVSILVNDIGSGLKQSVWGGGIAGKKDPGEFLPVRLAQ